MKKVDFLVVGTQKSGTSALYRYLREHSQIEMGKNKEAHFFDNEDNFKDKVNYHNYHQFFTDDESKVKGECTPIYMYWSSSISRIFEYNTQIKIITILRNPIDRAFSHWNMERLKNNDEIDFSTAIRLENDRCREALPLQHRIFSYTDRGFYSEQICRIWRYFPKGQTLFIKQENLKDHPLKVLDEISALLGISAFEDIKKMNVHSRPYVNTMSDNDFEYLSDLFCNDIKQVELMLSWDCSNWKK